MIFTDEIKPASAEVIDIDADSDGGGVAWTENDGTVMKVSTQSELTRRLLALKRGLPA